MKISVVIPTYKPQDYLYECLDSLACQSFLKDEFEVVLILNGCAEPYKGRIQKYIKENEHRLSLNLVHIDMGGVSNARNIGLDNARGEYITFIDDDDIVSANYLENLYKASSPTCIGCANSYCFTKNIVEKKDNFITKGYNKCKKNIKFSLYKYRSFLSAPWAKLIHKDIIKNNRFPLDLKKSEDSLFCMYISPNIHEMKLSDADTIYYQRNRDGSAMRTKTSIAKIVKEHLYIEWKYMSEWCKQPFNYNLLFVLSRIVACGKNCYMYIKKNM